MTPPSTTTHNVQQPALMQEVSTSSVHLANTHFSQAHASRHERDDGDLTDENLQAIASSIQGSQISSVSRNPTNRSKRKKYNMPQSSISQAKLTDTPSTTPRSRKTRRNFYCWFCNCDRKNNPSIHVRKHLDDFCSSIRLAEAYVASGSQDRVDKERLLLGCGFCGPTGQMGRYNGEAYLGPGLLAKHIRRQYHSPLVRLTWDNSNVYNNVLTSRVFRDAYEHLLESEYCFPRFTQRRWDEGRDTEKLLCALEKLGGYLIIADMDYLPIQEPRRRHIEAALAVGSTIIPNHQFGSALRDQAGMGDSMRATTSYMPDLQQNTQLAPITNNTDRVGFGIPVADPCSTEGMDTIGLAQDFANIDGWHSNWGVTLDNDDSCLDSSLALHA